MSIFMQKSYQTSRIVNSQSVSCSWSTSKPDHRIYRLGTKARSLSQ